MTKPGSRSRISLRATIWTPVLLIAGLLVFMAIPGCTIYVAEQRVPSHTITAMAEDFDVPADIAVLHYYGVGGWGIKWRDEYLLTAPYFSNHGFLGLFGRNGPDVDAIRTGVKNTPFPNAGLILVGHGHVDHAADIPGYAAAGLPAKQAGIIANDTTLNILASLMPPKDTFRCAESPPAGGGPIEGCGVPGIRITALPSHHAPNVRILGKEFTIARGTVDSPQPQIPARPADYKLGNTWAYLIDLLDENGSIALRIHYMDSVAGSEHGSIPESLLRQHAVDIHIACVPGFHYVDDYPEWVMDQGDAGYVLMGHWEDFFQPRERRLEPVTFVLSEKKLNRFVERIEQGLSDDATRPTLLNKSAGECAPDTDRCGPRGASWAMPIPGETFQFRPNRP